MQTDEEDQFMRADLDATGSMPDEAWRKYVIGKFAEHGQRVDLLERKAESIEQKVDTNTTMTQQVLDQTLEIRNAVTRGKWLAKWTGVAVRWFFKAIHLFAKWAAPIIAVAIAILAWLGVKWGPPPP